MVFEMGTPVEVTAKGLIVGEGTQGVVIPCDALTLSCPVGLVHVEFDGYTYAFEEKNLRIVQKDEQTLAFNLKVRQFRGVNDQVLFEFEGHQYESLSELQAAMLVTIVRKIKNDD